MLGIYSLFTKTYEKFLYYVPDKLYNTRNFSHLIYFKEDINKLVFWNIEYEYEEHLIEAPENYNFLDITDNYSFTIFMHENSIKSYNIDIGEWTDICLPERLLKNRLYDANKFNLLYSDNLEYFMVKHLTWIRSSDEIVDSNFYNYDKSRFFSQDLSNFCVIKGNKLIIEKIKDSNYVKEFDFTLGSFPGC